MRQFIVFIEGVDDDYKPTPNLVEAESFMDLLHKLDEVHEGDFSIWFDSPESEDALSDLINYSNGDGDRWYSVSEIVEGKHILKIWLG